MSRIRQVGILVCRVNISQAPAPQESTTAELARQEQALATHNEATTMAPISQASAPQESTTAEPEKQEQSHTVYGETIVMAPIVQTPAPQESDTETVVRHGDACKKGKG